MFFLFLEVYSMLKKSDARLEEMLMEKEKFSFSSTPPAKGVRASML
jgi:hypothetical protein